MGSTELNEKGTHKRGWIPSYIILNDLSVRVECYLFAGGEQSETGFWNKNAKFSKQI